MREHTFPYEPVGLTGPGRRCGNRCAVLLDRAMKRHRSPIGALRQIRTDANVWVD